MYGKVFITVGILISDSFSFSLLCCSCARTPALPLFSPEQHAHTHSYEKAKTDLGTALATLEAHLRKKKKADDNDKNKTCYLVGRRLTLADICVASTLLYPFKLVCDKQYLRPYTTVVEWFQHCVSRPEFRRVVGTVALCEKELKAAVGQQ